MKVWIILAALLSLTLQQTLINEINTVRTNPAGFAPIVSTYSDIYPAPNIQAAITTLNTTAAMAALTESKCLDNVSQAQANYSATTGVITNVDANQHTPDIRITQVVNASNATWSGNWFETTVKMANANYTAQDVVVYLLTGGFNATQNILNPQFLHAGSGNSSQVVTLDLVVNITC